ncbi:MULTISPECIES: SpoIIE family protein phosphatase [unclassified Candidatus Frackibacter]|uniref:SpoIIE family protein phosphatase n=1 Tax=unclassified Candidatus Frackibacter TaxID=2648818 RepID=UPI0007979AF5|nr:MULTISPECIES: SpoIIE family protein phosphatase [unclassified Candidatus Frackibacter]KXS44180.1 MAG: Ser/Thr phosphatase [Candidatus Frackibacter sp. T328-2]SDC64141.1 Stage II sporulation protein E (SpoIIE) [Candidatus Frackibacter sp. WG11]SEM77720.1 Stage II sporulation protein E (SpoIIE) [Candidatus Frackibacter sp. WG12]SFL88382.1 Stage II sporulation protein E (SpoIIE) [Candidatus Frackibacter sp. WG13]
MEVKIEIAKRAKYGVSGSGDTVEVVERPQGGFSVILADGQGSGRKAKTISNLVVNKAISLIGDGARDGAVGRAVHDYLYTLRHGKVSSTLNILSVDLDTDSIVLSRNSNTPIMLIDDDKEVIFDKKVKTIGFHKEVKPIINEVKLKPRMKFLAFSDGILHAGRRFDQQVKLSDIIEICKNNSSNEPQSLAKRILTHALELDKNRPQDDMTVVVLGLVENINQKEIKEYNLSLPI